MKKRAKPAATLAIVCGSHSAVGSAIVARLRASHAEVITIDRPGSGSHPLASFSHTGDLGDKGMWAALSDTLARQAVAPTMLVHALAADTVEADSGDCAAAESLCSAQLFCHYLLPRVTSQRGAVVLVTTVLGGWDHHPQAVALGACSQGVLALARGLALDSGVHQTRVNTVCHGLVVPRAETEAGGDLRRARGRVPLPTPTQPEDVAEAVLFLLGPDASYITGSTLVVDGGQTLQSWSNAPDDDGYPR